MVPRSSSWRCWAVSRDRDRVTPRPRSVRSTRSLRFVFVTSRRSRRRCRCRRSSPSAPSSRTSSSCSPRACARATIAAAATSPTAPETAALTAGRVDLAQLRAVSSYTALSLSAILTGRSQEGARDAILRSPSLFDFAHAAHDASGSRPVVAYFSSQSSTVFETDQVRAAVDRFASIETMRGHDVEDDANYADLPLDRDVVDLFDKTLPELPAPAVVMLHLANTHAPYFVDPGARAVRSLRSRRDVVGHARAAQRVSRLDLRAGSNARARGDARSSSTPALIRGSWCSRATTARRSASTARSITDRT